MFFRRSSSLHIAEHQGHKKLSLNNVSEFLKPEYIYIPLNESGSECDCLVKEGDKVKLGQIVATKTGRFGLPLHSSVSGEVTSVNKKMWHSSGKMIPMIEIKNDFQESKDESIKANDVDQLTKDEIIEIVQKCGIVGLGGAGFPAYAKYHAPNKITTIIINGVECEPYLTVDYMLFKTQFEKLISGIQYIIKATNADNAVIVVKQDKTELINLFNDQNKVDNIQLQTVKDVYPSGWEKYIVQRVVKKTYKHLPSEVGVVVNNVGTAIAICEAVEENKPLIEKMVTFTGKGLANPQNVVVKVGSVVNDIVENIGGYTEGVDSAYFIAGGPMSGRGIIFDSMVINRALNGVIIMPKEEPAELQPCIGCGKCCAYCPTFLSPIEIKRALDVKAEDRLVSYRADKCIECGICSYICPSRIELTEATAKSRGIVLSKGRS